MEADVARACDLPQKRRTTGREIEAKYGTYRDGARRVNVHTIRNIRGGGRPSLARKPHLAPRVARAPPPVDDVRFATVSLDTDIDIPHMRTPPARIAAAAPAA